MRTHALRHGLAAALPRKWERRVWLAVAMAVIVCITASSAVTAAAAPGHAGRIVLSLPGGALGPIVLAPGQGGWVGELTVTNRGAQPLTVSRIALRGDDDDVRSPSRLSGRFVAGAATSATRPPVGSETIVV